MLQRLHIRDLAIIDDLTLDFAEGFTVLTGETGAGKSIIIGALNLVLGERSSSDDVRSGCEGAVAEALFRIDGQERLLSLLADLELTGAGAEDETGDLVIRREVSAQGRSRCLVNGRLAPLGQLRRIGDLLVDLHGQHQHQSLLKVELHREILDAFGGESVARALDAYQNLFREHGEVVARLEALDRDERDIERRKGILEYQVGEIREAALQPGEDAALEEERGRLQHVDALQRNASGATDLLYEGESGGPTVSDLLAQCEEMAARSSLLDPSLGPMAGRLAAVRAEIEDVAASMRSYAASLESDPARLDAVEERLHLLGKIKSKYGESLEEVLAEGSRLDAELDALTHSREERERLEQERRRIESELTAAAETLSAKRHAAARKFSKGLGAELKELEMPGVRFEVRIGREEIGAAKTDGGDENGETEKTGSATESRGALFPDGKRYRVHPAGVDQVEFLISPNAGEDLKPLRRVASGGELSRVMLALKVLMRSQNQVPTLVFDEIDTGISGRTGTRIGEKMARLGEAHQIICITHLPQIAARGTRHFAVRKEREKGRTVTRVEALSPSERGPEIARLLGGDADSAAARQHAEELLGVTDA